jgi:hypothetical protein
MRVYFESDLNDFVTQNIITRYIIFSNPLVLEESKFTNVFVTDLFSPVVKPAMCSAMQEVLRWASHNSVGVKLLRESEKSEYPKGVTYPTHDRHTPTIL